MKKYTDEDLLRHVPDLPPPLNLTNVTELRETLEALPPSPERFERMLDAMELALNFFLRLEDDPQGKALMHRIVLRKTGYRQPWCKVLYEFETLPQRTYGERGVNDLRAVIEAWVTFPDAEALVAHFWRLWLGQAYHNAFWGAWMYLELHLRSRPEHPAAVRLVNIAARHWTRQSDDVAFELVSASAIVAGPGAFALLDTVIEAPPDKPPFIDEPDSEGITFRENFRDQKYYEMEKIGLVPPRPPPPDDDDDDDFST